MKNIKIFVTIKSKKQFEYTENTKAIEYNKKSIKDYNLKN